MTMRSLAAAVGMTAAGLYRYIASRDELIGHMVDHVSADLAHPPPSGDWVRDFWVRDFIVVTARQRALFVAHPWLAEAEKSLRVLGPHVLDHLDWGLAVLADVPSPPARKMEAIALANGMSALFASASRPVVGPEAFAALDAGRHPRLAALFAAASQASPSSDLFESVLEGVLRGVPAGPAQPPGGPLPR